MSQDAVALDEAQESVDEIEEGVEAPADDREWYVIHTYSGYENKVKTNLEHRVESMGVQDKIFQVVIPTEEEIEIRDGQRRTVQKKVFPGYVLVQMVLAEGRANRRGRRRLASLDLQFDDCADLLRHLLLSRQRAEGRGQ